MNQSNELYSYNKLLNTGFLRIPNVSIVTGLAKSTIWYKVKQGTFPTPIKISQRITAWRSEDIQRWLANPNGWKNQSTEGTQS